MPCASVYIPVTFNLFTLSSVPLCFSLSFVAVKSSCLRFQCAGVLHFESICFQVDLPLLSPQLARPCSLLMTGSFFACWQFFNQGKVTHSHCCSLQTRGSYKSDNFSWFFLMTVLPCDTRLCGGSWSRGKNKQHIVGMPARIQLVLRGTVPIHYKPAFYKRAASPRSATVESCP